MNIVQLIDYFYNAIVDPEKLSQIIAVEDKKHFAISAIVIAVVVFMDIVAQSLLTVQSGFFYYKLTYGFVALFLINIVCIVVYAGLLTITLQIAGYQASGGFIINALALAQVPRIFIVPVVLIFHSLYFAPVFFYSFGSLALILWSIIIAMRCISQRYSLEAIKAIGYLAAPVIVAGVIGFLIFVAGVMVIIGLLS
ncbi:MAG: hypothetical protein QHH74_06455 [Spirochaetota bacterium]|nr:hypothetical protein [Spirochaetota bacterium]